MTNNPNKADEAKENKPEVNDGASKILNTYPVSGSMNVHESKEWLYSGSNCLKAMQEFATLKTATLQQQLEAKDLDIRDMKLTIEQLEYTGMVKDAEITKLNATVEDRETQYNFLAQRRNDMQEIMDLQDERVKELDRYIANLNHKNHAMQQQADNLKEAAWHAENNCRNRELNFTAGLLEKAIAKYNEFIHQYQSNTVKAEGGEKKGGENESML